MTISIRAMQLYVTVLDAGNFSEVARREGTSPSRVSRVIRQMEEALGLQLLYRNTRTIVPTEAGLMYGNTFRQVLDELNDTAQRLRDRQNSPAGLVRINAPVVFGQKHIAPWLAELAGHYPELRVELMQTDDFVDPLAGTADLLFRIAPLQDPGLRVRVIDSRPVYHLAASPEYVSRFGFPRSPADLAAHRLLVYKGVMGPQRIFLSRGDQAPIIHTPDAILLSNNAETLVSAALKGAGIVLMPDWQTGELLLQKRLIRLLPEWQAGVSQEKSVIAMVYPQARFIPLNVRTVSDFLAEKFGSPPYWKYD